MIIQMEYHRLDERLPEYDPITPPADNRPRIALYREDLGWRSVLFDMNRPAVCLAHGWLKEGFTHWMQVIPPPALEEDGFRVDRWAKEAAKGEEEYEPTETIKIQASSLPFKDK